MTDSESKLKAIQLAVAQLDKQYGAGSVIFGDQVRQQVDVISTGNFRLDLALEVGGFPRGRIVEIFGGEGLGKTLLGLSTVVQCQRAGGIAAYIDVECDLSPEWAERIGVDIDSLLISQPSYGEEALEIAERLLSTGAIDLLIIDSVAAMTPKAEMDGSMEDNHIGLQARMMAQGLRKLRPIINDSQAVVIFINQIRDKIGFMQQGTTSPGGRSLKFASSVRIELKRMGDIKGPTGESIGTNVKANIIKNKVGRPMRTIEYENIHGLGINNTGSIIDMAVKAGFVKKGGAWYSLIDDENIKGQGTINFARTLEDNPDILEKLKVQIMESYA